MTFPDQIDQVDEGGFRQDNGLDSQIVDPGQGQDADGREHDEARHDEEGVGGLPRHRVIVGIPVGLQDEPQEIPEQQVAQEDAGDDQHPDVVRPAGEEGGIIDPVAVHQQDERDDEDQGDDVAVAADADAALQGGAAAGPREVVQQIGEDVQEVPEEQEAQQDGKDDEDRCDDRRRAGPGDGRRRLGRQQEFSGPEGPVHRQQHRQFPRFAL